MKIIAIAFSDLHINDWSRYNKDNQRTLNHFRVLSIIDDLCKKYNCIALFCGDLFHKSESMSQELSLINQEYLGKLTFNCLAIEGNHDLHKVSTIKTPVHGWISYFSRYYPVWLTDLSFSSYDMYPTTHRKIKIHGVPYIDHNIGLNDYLKKLELEEDYKHILLLHTDYPGAEDTDGRRVDSVENLNLNILNRFDLVLCGHIHKPQRLSKKVYMVGAPIQQRRTDKNCKLGYWEIYEDLSVKFKELKGFPKFIDVESEDEIKDDGNYYTVVPKPKTSEQEVTTHKITKHLTKTKLAKQYLKEKGIRDEKKQNLLIKTLKRTEE